MIDFGHTEIDKQIQQIFPTINKEQTALLHKMMLLIINDAYKKGYDDGLKIGDDWELEEI